MANTPIEFDFPTGEADTVDLYQILPDGGAIAMADDTATESPAGTGTFRVTHDSNETGVLKGIVKNNGARRGSFFVGVRKDDTTVYQAVASFEESRLGAFGEYTGGNVWVGGPTVAIANTGTVVGVNGTEKNPTVNWSDASTIANARLIRRLKVLEAIHNSAVVSGMFSMNVGQGLSNYIIDLNGSGWKFPNAMQSTNRTEFWNGRLQAETGQTMRFDNNTGGIRMVNMDIVGEMEWDCRFSDLIDTRLSTAFTFLQSDVPLSTRFIGCRIWNSEPSLTLNFHESNTGNVPFVDWDGNMVLTGMAQAGLNVHLLRGAGKLTINDSCEDGVVNVAGMQVVDEAGNPWQNGDGKPTVNFIAGPSEVIRFAQSATDQLANYWIDVSFAVDSDNARDEYTVRWKKNTTLIEDGITSPTIRVVSGSGVELISETAMGDGGEGRLIFNESDNRQTPGEDYEVFAEATIDGETRTDSRILGRDS